jgi:DNA polymerase III subunit epsilon
MEFAIVDIETTGGSAVYNKIVEIAIVVHNGWEEIERFQTLINPQKYIPNQVTLIHGITNEMVQDAPVFEAVAKEILRLTTNRVFVAHSVNFDYSFVKTEFQNLGIDFNRKKLCTVRLSRQLFAGNKSYSLGNICSHLNIPIYDRHRAMGDAEATALLFARLFEKDVDKSVFKQFLNQRSKEMALPPHLDKKSFDALPMLTGVYFLHDHHGKIVYVGKAKNIKDRVSEHFSGNTHTKARQNFINSIYDVSFEVIGSEFLALLVENEAIKKHFPKFNKSNKTFDLNYGIFQYENQKGFVRLVAAKSGKKDKPLATFNSILEVQNALTKLSIQHGLCLKLNGIIAEKDSICAYTSDFGTKCSICDEKVSIDVYNELVKAVINELNKGKSFIIKTTGRKRDEEGFVLVEQGKFLGYGYVSVEEQITDVEQLKDYLITCYDTQDSQAIIKAHLPKAKLLMTKPTLVYKIN